MTIEKRRVNQDGTTSYRLSCEIDGRRYRKTIRCTSKMEANREHTRFLMACSEHKVSRKAVRWPVLCDIWYREYAEVALKKTSQKSAKSNLDTHIRAAWRKDAGKITRQDVQTFVASLSHLSPKTVKNIYSTVTGIFKWAVQKEIIASSPCEYITLPRQTKKNPAYLDKDTFSAFMTALESAPVNYRAGIYLALFAGLRRGEIHGLTWDNVDFVNQILYVSQARHPRIGGGTYTDTPKTLSSKRRVAMPYVLSSELKKLRKSQIRAAEALGTSWGGGEYVICTEHGTPLYPDRLSKWLSRFIKDNNLPYFTLHSLRHTHATLLRYLGAGIDEISARLGHSEKATTENIYTHIFERFEEVDKRAAVSLDNFVYKKGQKRGDFLADCVMQGRKYHISKR